MAATEKTLEAGSIPYEVLDRILEKYQGDPSAIIPILQDIQEEFDYVPKEGIGYLGEKLGVSPAKIYGIATFYAQFRLQPKGKHTVMLCVGTACHVNGAKMVGNTITDELGIKGGETTEDGLFTYEEVACIGCCSLSPVMLIDGETYAMLTPKSTRKIIKEFRGNNESADQEDAE